MANDPELDLIEQARRQAAALRESSDGSDRARLIDGACGDPRRAMPLPITLPSYRITREIHRGGQGVVYLGFQESTRREVAIKVMREGPFAGPRDRARFEREVHVLAALRHPNIVTIHDSGTTSGGFFYYVMDYIDGQPLDEYVATHRPPVAECVRLFAKICAAVNAAHLLGVIHRDLKPGNVRIDKSGEPHVLDFGLAKLISASEHSSNDARMTEAGQFVGTLPWASPEQAEGRTDDIDVRTDVYSLGVMLFHLLTGTFPYSVAGGVRAALNTIVNAEPARPRRLNREIDDELETIVLKCLAKQPEKRYRNAGDLSLELQRYSRGEAIEAKRDSRWYLLRKSAQRHRTLVAIAVQILALLTVCGAALTVMYWRQVDLREKAESQATAARQQRDRAEQNERQARRSEQFLEEMLLLNLPEHAVGHDPALLRKLLDSAAERVETEFVDQPEVESAIRATIGRVYSAFSAYETAEHHLGRSLELRTELFGKDHPVVAETQIMLGSVMRNTGQTDRADELLTAALRTFSDDAHRDAPSVALALQELGTLHISTGRWLEAENQLREALRLRSTEEPVDPTRVASVKHDLAVLLTQLARPDEAEPLFRQALAVQLQNHDGVNGPVVRGLFNLAALLITKSQFEQAEQHLRRAEDVANRLYRDDHVVFSYIQNVRVMLLLQRGEFREAADLCRSAVASVRARLGREHMLTLKIMTKLAFALTRVEQRDEAEAVLREALEIGRATLGVGHPTYATVQVVLANLLRVQNRFDEAETLVRESWKTRIESLGDSHSDTISALAELAYLLAVQRRYEEAAPLFARCLAASETRYGPMHMATARVRSHYGAALGNLRRFDQAEIQLVAAVEALETLGQIESFIGQSTLRRLIGLYRAWGKAGQATRYEHLLVRAPSDVPEK